MTRGRPHAGLKVVEIARILAGPWIGQTLADLGADVTKVESPNGDDTRQWGPPFVHYGDGSKDAGYFHACNRGKKSIALDFSNPSDREIVRDLVRDADVLIENFKVGGLSKYGLDYDSLSEINPSLIYCSITGFGQSGPYAKRAGYDFIVQAMSGVMDITGEADGDPQKIGVAFADIFTGLYGVIAIQAALARRARDGVGEHIDMALMDSMVGVLANQGMNYLLTGSSPRRMGNVHPNIAPYQLFQASDGPFALAIGNDVQFRRFCDLLGLGDCPDHPKFRSNSARVENREALSEIIEARTTAWKLEYLLDELERINVPAGPINDLRRVFSDPQVVARQLQINFPAKSGRVATAGIRSPIWLGDGPQVATAAAPRLDANRREILDRLAARRAGSS